MPTPTIEVAIPEELQTKLAERLKHHGSDAHRYRQEVVAKDLTEMLDADRQRCIDATFDAIDHKYGEALKNLAK